MSCIGNEVTGLLLIFNPPFSADEREDNFSDLVQQVNFCPICGFSFQPEIKG
jgi:hypothetical protein